VQNIRVAVAGGSLGGLTAALLLRDLGHDVTIFERSRAELEQRGAGIGFLPDSARYLVERAGYSLDEISTSTSVIRYLNRAGEPIHEVKHAYHLSSWNTVYRNLLRCFGTERYRLGHEVIGRTEKPNNVEVHFADGTTRSTDLLVCADGVSSTFREQLLPSVTRTYAGYVGWRGMILESALDAQVVQRLADATSYYVFANSHILIYPIPGPTGSVKPGERLINFVWYRNYAQGDDLNDLLTDITGAPREVSLAPGAIRPEHIAEMRATAVARLPQVMSDVVCAVAEPFLQVVFDVDVDHMAFGRTCLIGDAAFIARPHAAAGTAKAAANAWALTEAIEKYDTVPEALAAWEPEQIALGKQLIERTRRLGTHSQVTGTWSAFDPDVLFRLRQEGP
jgi:2,6-dihydroxypyridine 3-monooxygenase